ncbi:MAG: hypothetical protein AB7U30_05470 [Sulfuricellaceae bacterium]|jgi:hypothetical protein
MRMTVLLALAPAILAGCATMGGGPAGGTAPVSAGKGVEYRQPEAIADSKYAKTVAKPLEAAWGGLTAAAEKSAFGVDNANAQGHSLALRFKADPEPYVDCGRITSSGKAAKGKQKYDFPAASARQEYEIAGRQGVYAVERRMALEAKVQVVLSEAGVGKTRARAKAYYTLTKTIYVRKLGTTATDTVSDKVEFDSTRPGIFQVGGKDGTVCRATGKLEAKALSLLE